MKPNENRGVWDEEQMCYLAPIPQSLVRSSRFASGLRNDVSARNVLRSQGLGIATERTRGATPSVIYAPQDATLHGNFTGPAYKRIMARSEWRARFDKVHSAKRQAKPTGEREEVREWKELDAATSSDALLMNIFCYPRVLNKRLCALLGVQPKTIPEFGYKPHLPLKAGLMDRMEIDMKLGDALIEAKLTESDFQQAPLRLLERYPKFNSIFHLEECDLSPRGLRSYQLLRGVMAAEAENGRYFVFLDERRPDLLEQWFSVMKMVRSYELQSRLRVLTWQEISETLPQALQKFLTEKYGISSRHYSASSNSDLE